MSSDSSSDSEQLGRYTFREKIDKMDKCAACKQRRSGYSSQWWDCKYSALRAAKAEGCHRCSLTFDAISAYKQGGTYPDDTKIRTYPDYKISATPERGGYALDQLIVFNSKGSSQSWWNFRRAVQMLGLAAKSPKSQIFTRKKHHKFDRIESSIIGSGDTSSRESASLVKSWIKDCVDGHENCPSFHDSALPKRILEIRHDKIFLRENVTGLHQYACLSHCWGDSGLVMQTTSSTIDKFKCDGIQITDLPPTFRNAVEFCSKIDLKYLWIDALCIIQHDQVDWREAATNMAKIYEQAYITIAASMSRNSTEGFYSQTEDKYIPKPVGSYELLVRHVMPEFPTSWTSDVLADWPLFARGWVYQERRLSPRMVHFSKQEIFWECVSERKSENGYHEDFAHGSYRNMIREATPFLHLNDDPITSWQKSIEEYSGLALTFETDRLPAIAALVERMGKIRIGDSYIAGVWRNSLIDDMSWIVWPRKRDTDRPAEWRAPTWSWVAATSRVQWVNNLKPISDIEVLDVQYELTGAAHVGRVTSASLTMRAPLIPARTGGYNSYVISDIASEYKDVKVFQTYDDYDHKKSELHRVPMDAELFLVPLLQCHHDHFCVILRKTETAGTYERIAGATIQHEEYNKFRPGDRGNDKSDLVKHVNDYIASVPFSTFRII